MHHGKHSSSAIKAHNSKLSADAAREVIAQGVSDVFAVANIESLESATIKSWGGLGRYFPGSMRHS